MGSVQRPGRRRTAGTRSLVDQVVFALQELGGAAHRDVIAARVNVYLRTGQSKTPAHVLQQVEQTLRSFERSGGGHAGRVLFTRVFGPDTHRWALISKPAEAGGLAAAAG